MNPLIAVAVGLIPDILKAIVGEKDKAKAEQVSGAVVKAVKEVTGTDDPVKAQEAVAADPAVATALRVKLAEIAAEEEEKKRRAGLDELKLRLEEETRKQEAALAAAKTQLDAESKKRTEELAELTARLGDVQHAARPSARSIRAARWPGEPRWSR